MSAEYTLRVWNPELGTALAKLSFGASGSSVAFSEDGQLFAAPAWETVYVFRPEGPTRIDSFMAGNKHQAANVVAFSPDGQIVATGGDEGIVRGRLIQKQEDAFQFNGSISGSGYESIIALAYCNDGNTVISSAVDGTVREWNVAGKQLVEDVRLELAKNTYLKSAAIAKDCESLAGTAEDRLVRLWRLPRPALKAPPSAAAADWEARWEGKLGESTPISMTLKRDASVLVGTVTYRWPKGPAMVLEAKYPQYVSLRRVCLPGLSLF
jgi:WD40 repeat protein